MEKIEQEFILERERRYLVKNPFRAREIAIAYLEDFLYLAKEIKVLEEKYQSVMADNQALRSQLIDLSSSKVVRLPSFLPCKRH